MDGPGHKAEVAANSARIWAIIGSAKDSITGRPLSREMLRLACTGLLVSSERYYAGMPHRVMRKTISLEYAEFARPYACRRFHRLVNHAFGFAKHAHRHLVEFAVLANPLH